MMPPPGLETTYLKGWDEDGMWIECKLCRYRSYNAGDVKNNYCGNCHIFHDPNFHNLAKLRQSLKISDLRTG